MRVRTFKGWFDLFGFWFPQIRGKWEAMYL